MTSPRQRKKRLALLKLRKKQEEQKNLEQQKLTKQENPQPAQQQPVAKPVDPTPPPVVESEATSKVKKSKIALVETKPPDQVLEQSKQEVKPAKEETKKD